MDKRGKRQSASIFGGMGFYIALLVCVVAAGVVGYLALLSDEEVSDGGNGDPAQVVDQSDGGIVTPVGDTVRQEDQQVSSGESIVTPAPQPAVKPDLADAPKIEDKDQAQEVPVSGEITVPDTRGEEPEESAPVVERIVLPLAGSTVSVFSADRLMYDATLDDWRTHDGIDIRAEALTPVVAAASGTVIAVGEDDRLGVNVQIEHAQGYVTTYASLHPEVAVQVGDQVKAGDVIGAVGNTSLSEAALGAHLHFSVTRNGELIDPSAYLPKES